MAFALLYFTLSIVLPIAALVLSAVRTSPYMMSFRDLTKPGSVDFSSFGTVLHSDLFLSAAGNSVVVALLAAAAGTVLSFLVAYVLHRTKARGRGALQSVSMVQRPERRCRGVRGHHAGPRS
ncbi:MULTISPECIES: hypothetical protein [unclassified Micromonospora]|uniref:hypothetical protein n=1 Tax=unclassified Micromonospora TaxID=2617518 RepID=UPI0033AF9192